MNEKLVNNINHIFPVHLKNNYYFQLYYYEKLDKKKNEVLKVILFFNHQKIYVYKFNQVLDFENFV